MFRNSKSFFRLACIFGEVDEVKDVNDGILMGGGSCLVRNCYVALCVASCNVDDGFLPRSVVNEMYDKGIEVDVVWHFRNLQEKGYIRHGLQAVLSLHFT